MKFNSFYGRFNSSLYYAIVDVLNDPTKKEKHEKYKEYLKYVLYNVMMKTKKPHLYKGNSFNFKNTLPKEFVDKWKNHHYYDITKWEEFEKIEKDYLPSLPKNILKLHTKYTNRLKKLRKAENRSKNRKKYWKRMENCIYIIQKIEAYKPRLIFGG